MEAEELRIAKEELKSKVKSLIDEFVAKHGECSVNIRTYANFTTGVSMDFYIGHDIDIDILI